MYRLILFKEGKRMETLLSSVDKDIQSLFKLLEKNDTSAAVFPAGRAVIVSRGALVAHPDETRVKGAVKLAEGFQNLVLAAQSSDAEKWDEVLQLTSDAWHLGEKAKEFDSSLNGSVAQLQSLAKNLADKARRLKE
jgi:hypothetical protein